MTTSKTKLLTGENGGARNGSNGARDLDVDLGGQTVGQAKFDISSAVASLPEDKIPWGYGENRVTAMSRDPDWLYIYWEITDDGIQEARRKIGAAGGGAWCALRIYDATGVIFDGTNARDLFDIAVDRSSREWFVHVGKPTSSHFVEIGLKSQDGRFQTIARSGRVDFPRKSPATAVDPEWMAVYASPEEAEHAAAQQQASRFAAPEPELTKAPEIQQLETPNQVQPPMEKGIHYELIPTSKEMRVDRSLPSVGTSLTMRTEPGAAAVSIPWTDTTKSQWQGDERVVEIFGHPHAPAWQQPFHAYSWTTGAYPIALSGRERVEVRQFGHSLFMHRQSQQGAGPWEITIKSFSENQERRVLGSWFVHWVRSTTPVFMRFQSGETHQWATDQPLFMNEALWIGASEQSFLGASQYAWPEFLYGSVETLIGGSLGAEQAKIISRTETVLSNEIVVSDNNRVVKSGWLEPGEKDKLAPAAPEFQGASEMLGGASEQNLIPELPGNKSRPGESDTRLGGASEENLELGFPTSFNGNDGER